MERSTKYAEVALHPLVNPLRELNASAIQLSTRGELFHYSSRARSPAAMRQIAEINDPAERIIAVSHGSRMGYDTANTKMARCPSETKKHPTDY